MRDFETKILKQSKGSPTVKLLSKGIEMQRQGIDVLLFAGGEPDFDTPNKVKEATIEALNNNFTHYASSSGVMELKERIAKKLKEENNIDVDPKSEIVITPGAKLSLYQSILAFIEAGDEVLILEPCYVSYNEIVRLAGGTPISVQLNLEDSFVITKEELEKYATPATKMLIVGNPCNPTGHVLSKDEVNAIAEFAIEHDILVISDEIYERITYDNIKHYSIASLENMKERTLTINGLSKSCAMTGWRLGYVAADKNLINPIMKLQASTVNCVNTFTQMGAIKAFDCQDEIKAMVDEYTKRRDYFVEELNKIPCINCPTPEGAFYIFCKIDYKNMDSFELADFILKEANILVSPGDVFGKGGEKCIRFSYATSMENIKMAVERLNKIFI
ncbi:pyridoxal phosphate-dependent aminotransferase [Intestinibacter sp.]|uniref:pyridoxal phosphate-dependent aminotransferase n=1 Tax=Intestinibacter sp. TaxID=1965304 RepID=UPI003F18B3EE